MNHHIAALLTQIKDYRRRGDYNKAGQIRDRIIDLCEGMKEDEFIPVVESLVNDFVLFGHVSHARSAEAGYARLAAVIEQRLGDKHPLTLKAQENLANVYAYQGRYVEAARLMAALIPHLKQQVEGRPEALEIPLTNLEIWYKNAGLQAEAVAVRAQLNEQLPVCEHLKPLEDYLIRADIPITGRATWGGVVVSVDAYLDTEALQRNLALDPCIECSELDDPHYGFAIGLECSIHHDRIWGLHPREKKKGPTLTGATLAGSSHS